MTPEQIARVCHEANRALQTVLADPAIPVAEPWDDLTEPEQSITVAGVRHALNGHGPRELHESWASEKWDAGWRFGPVKDPAAKTHPCMVPYDQLPERDRVKDVLFAAIVGALAGQAGVFIASSVPADVNYSRSHEAAGGAAQAAGAVGYIERNYSHPHRPAVGRVVHYVSEGSPVLPDGSQRYPSTCRAAIITETTEHPDADMTVGLCVLNPTGLFLNREIPCDLGGTPEHAWSPGDGYPLPLRPATCTGLEHAGGTWHWPVTG